MLKPLEQWICDTCGEVIESPEQGYVDWVCEPSEEDQTIHSFRIVHHANFSPRRPRGNCYRCADGANLQSSALSEFIGVKFLVRLFDFLEGPYLIGDTAEFVDFARRLSIPCYEDASQYRGRAIDDGLCSDDSAFNQMMPDQLRQIVQRYESVHIAS